MSYSVWYKYGDYTFITHYSCLIIVGEDAACSRCEYYNNCICNIIENRHPFSTRAFIRIEEHKGLYERFKSFINRLL